MRLPIDTKKMVLLHAGTEPLTVFGSSEPARDKDTGQPMFRVHVAVLGEGRKPEVWAVKVAGEPKGLVPGAPVTATGLVVMDWAQGDRHGLSFSAETIVPVAGATGLKSVSASAAAS